MYKRQEHLIPKQLEKHGLKSEQLTISKKAIWKIARNYTKEAGVRQLERKIGDICRKSAREILEEKKKTIHVTERNLHLYLGKELYIYQMKNEQDEVGIVRGLAWTSVGGDTLEIEVNVMPGEGEILLTGQLGDVMKESARTGISYIRSVSKEYGIDEKFFKEHDIHIHIPEGATPKDGPSAGITMAKMCIRDRCCSYGIGRSWIIKRKEDHLLSYSGTGDSGSSSSPHTCGSRWKYCYRKRCRNSSRICA